MNGKESSILPEERRNFLKGYEDPGTFSPEQMGAPSGEGLIMLSRALIMARPTLMTSSIHNPFEFATNNGISGRTVFFNPQTHQYDFSFERYPVKIRIPGISFPEKKEDLNHAMTEGSFIADGFNDLLFYSRLFFLYQTVENTIAHPKGIALWQMDPRERLPAIKSTVAKMGNLAFIADMNAKQLEDTIEITSRIINDMTKQKIETGLQVMKDMPAAMAGIGAYIFGLLKSGLDKGTFPDNNCLKQTIVSLAKSENAPETINVAYPTIKSRYSTYLNLCYDLAIRRMAPLSFAFGNKATLEALDMLDKNYVTRMRATRTNLDLTGFRLHSLTKLINEHEGVDMTVLVTPKSIYTAVAEAIDLNKNEFNVLLKENNIEAPAPGQMKIGEDFDNIVALNQLLEKWQGGESTQRLDLFIDQIYQRIKLTGDLVRGSAYPPDKYFNTVVDEAIQREDIDVNAMLQYHDEKGSPYIFIDFKDLQSRQKLTQELGLPEDATPLDIINKWYEMHKGKYPYGAIHLYGKAEVTLSPYRGNPRIPPQECNAEVRMTNKSHEQETYDSRRAFKGFTSGHDGLKVIDS